MIAVSVDQTGNHERGERHEREVKASKLVKDGGLSWLAVGPSRYGDFPPTINTLTPCSARSGPSAGVVPTRGYNDIRQTLVGQKKEAIMGRWQLAVRAPQGWETVEWLAVMVKRPTKDASCR
jgi:hypothetical protein